MIYQEKLSGLLFYSCQSSERFDKLYTLNKIWWVIIHEGVLWGSEFLQSLPPKYFVEFRQILLAKVSFPSAELAGMVP